MQFFSGVEKWLTRWSHNPKIVGSIPTYRYHKTIKNPTEMVGFLHSPADHFPADGTTPPITCFGFLMRIDCICFLIRQASVTSRNTPNRVIYIFQDTSTWIGNRRGNLQLFSDYPSQYLSVDYSFLDASLLLFPPM